MHLIGLLSLLSHGIVTIVMALAPQIFKRCLLLFLFLSVLTVVLRLQNFFWDTPFVHDADRWIYPMFAKHWVFGWPQTFVDQKKGLFPFGLSYGGISPITGLRMVVLQVSKWLQPMNFWNHLQYSDWIWFKAHLIISELVTPILILGSVLFYSIRIFDFKSGVACGLLAAAGFPYAETLYGLDTFSWFIFSCFVLLGIRGKSENPLREFSPSQLILTSIFIGYSTYVMRASVMLLPVLIIPFSGIGLAADRLRRPRKSWDQLLVGCAILFTMLAAYTYFYGRELGVLGGRRIVLDPYPNLRIAIGIFGVWIVGSFYSHLNRRDFRSLGLIILGFSIGVFPEIYEVAFNSTPLFRGFTTGGDDVDFAKVAIALSEVVQGPKNAVHPENLLWHSYLILILWSSCIFAKTLLRFDFQKVKTVLPPLFLFGFNLFAFFRVKNSSAASSRYLIGFLPLLIWILGYAAQLYGDRIKKASGFGWFKPGVFVFTNLCAFLAVSQHNGAVKMLANERANTITNQALAEIVNAREYKIDLMLSDSHWDALPRTIQAHGNPIFIQQGELRMPQLYLNRFEASTKVGAIVPSFKESISTQFMKAWEASWRVQYLKGINSSAALVELIR